MKVSNVDRLKAKIAALAPATKEEIRSALTASAEEIVQLQKRLVPVDRGDLQMSITWQWGNEAKIAYSQTLGTISGEHELAVRISAGNSKVRYAHLVEFGTHAHIAGGKFEGAQIPAIPAHPFFYPGYRLGRKRAKSRISRAITKAAKKVAAGS
jgi:HK97 gp10 family phage protein